MRAITSLYGEEWHDKQEIIVDDVLSLTMAVSVTISLSTGRGSDRTFQAALMIISAAAFGRRTDWRDDKIPPGHRLSFKCSIAIVATGLFIRTLCPEWIFEWAPVEKIREARDGFSEFRVRSPLTRLRICTILLRIDLTRTVVFVGVNQ